MATKKIYSLFRKKIEELKISKEDEKKKKYRVIISFEDASNRDKFVSKYKNLQILENFDLIPSILVNLTENEISSFKNENLIKQIEEDQKLFASMLEVLEILDLYDYKTSQILYTGKDITVGIIDDGIDNSYVSFSKIPINHFILSNKTKTNAFKVGTVNVTHGTVMASIICNQFRDSNDIYIGISPKVKLNDFNISNEANTAYMTNILKVFDLIIDQKLDVDILLIPFISKDPSDGMDVLSFACNKLVDNGMIIVCPAGNFGPESSSIGSPGAAKNVITIGAINKDLTIPYYSGRGPTLDKRMKPEFCLPGSNIKVPLLEDFHVKVTGTSVAASIGVGIIALIKESHRMLTSNDILEIIKTASINLNHENNEQGFGIPNVVNLFKNLDLYQERVLPYSYLIRRSLKVSIELFILILILFYLSFFFMIS